VQGFFRYFLLFFFFFVISKYKAPFLLININIKKKKKLLVLSTHVPASGCHPRCLKRHVRHISATKNDQLPCQQKHSVTNQLIRWLLFLFPLFPDLEFHVRPSKIQLCPRIIFILILVFIFLLLFVFILILFQVFFLFNLIPENFTSFDFCIQFGSHFFFIIFLIYLFFQFSLNIVFHLIFVSNFDPYFLYCYLFYHFLNLFCFLI